MEGRCGVVQRWRYRTGELTGINQNEGVRKCHMGTLYLVTQFKIKTKIKIWKRCKKQITLHGQMMLLTEKVHSKWIPSPSYVSSAGRSKMLQRPQSIQDFVNILGCQPEVMGKILLQETPILWFQTLEKTK